METNVGQQARRSGRVLGLDHGDRRIGVAVSDELGVTAQPVLTLHCSDRRRAVRSLAALARKFRCSEIVLGLPLSMSGKPSQRSVKAQELAAVLREATGLPVHLRDERLSTAEAHRHLDEVGRNPGSRRAVVDQLAAVLILQSFLDARAIPPPWRLSPVDPVV